ncbi:copper homeostasis protein CutC [Salinimicrobium tongyeongense]|uniref:PF03932 family protein CutC n=1 Tax=Salinimicrobium tongyeongense TaxID=2809707 RepID=A0ABY6NRA4_9FLAO|nr:copper homeostasis protein CutC [Salinimicrobium tongyeongense]UZH55432.1 copper homeostasis protein CutC [Salinimicrobium tongyeongense]
MKKFIKEACVGNLEEAIRAEAQGADRIELCTDLHLDGLTPSEELIKTAKEQLNIPIRVMIRPRSGDFLYTPEELKEIKASIEFCKSTGVEAVVFGILNSKNELDIEKIEQLTQFSAPLKVVVHKAIDFTNDPLENLEKLLKIKGISSVLTSGGAETAEEGKELLKKMLELCGNGVEIVPAGKISCDNLEELHEYLGARAYHGKRIVGDLH